MTIKNMLHESQTQKNIYDYILCPEQVNTQRQKADSLLSRDGGWDWGLTDNDHGLSFWGYDDILKLDCVDGCTTLRTQ